MTIAVDFDGPVHHYNRGWQDGTIYGGETPGAFAALRSLMALDAVFIHTSRDTEQVAAWLREHGFESLADDDPHQLQFWNVRGLLLVTGHKYPAHAYVDDRAVPFTGDWQEAIAGAAELSPVIQET